MDKKIRRYSHDRRRQKKRKIISVAATILLMIAAGFAGWFIYPSAYEFFTRERQAESSSDSSLPESSSPISVSAPVEPPVPEQTEQRRVFLPASALAGAELNSLFAGLRQDGYTGVVFELKDIGGTVLYQSAAAQPQAVSPSAYDLAAAASAAKNAGLTVGGQMYAFRDPTAARLLYSSAVKYNHTEINWIDDSQANGGKPWLNPNNTEAQNYILALAEDAFQAGVSDIIMLGAQFPTGYSLNLATFSAKGVPVDKSSVLAAFFSKAANMAEEYNARVWFALDIPGLLGTDEIRYGGNVAKIISAGGHAALDISPAQFGSSFVFEELTLTAPALDPYGAVEAALALAELPEAQYCCIVQAYTSETLPPASNKTYTYDDISAQIRAAEGFGITDFMLYSPSGQYPAPN